LQHQVNPFVLFLEKKSLFFSIGFSRTIQDYFDGVEVTEIQSLSGLLKGLEFFRPSDSLFVLETKFCLLLDSTANLLCKELSFIFLIAYVVNQLNLDCLKVKGP
jgi:hypothetical protein